MTYTYYKIGTNEFMAVTSGYGYIEFSKHLNNHTMSVGISEFKCKVAMKMGVEIEKDVFFDWLEYPVAVLDRATKFFKKGDPHFEATSKAETERHDYYLELKNKPYH